MKRGSEALKLRTRDFALRSSQTLSLPRGEIARGYLYNLTSNLCTFTSRPGTQRGLCPSCRGPRPPAPYRPGQAQNSAPHSARCCKNKSLKPLATEISDLPP